MRFIRFIDESGNILTGCDYDGTTASLVSHGADFFNGYELVGKREKVSTLLCPVLPRAILCIGLNYRRHAEETGMPIPTHPVLFMKNPAAMTGPAGDIVIPRSCLDPLQVDYEVELGVVIGTNAKNVPVDDAMNHVFGYTCANDISARRWQKNAGGGQWVRGKSFDTFCPAGPELVTKDEINDAGNLNLTCLLNGEVMQCGNSSDMIFPVPELISRLSQSMTILAGTLILTGTPSGVGFARTPQVYLKPGDILESRIDGVGKMINPVTAETVP
ncbi:MAG: fumarylacetoacetate hydrolase family protein [Desulfamplus sp.]|nr:fumarylacetoacetate hydrolase family protein [Desulfamplus sp.]